MVAMDSEIQDTNEAKKIIADFKEVLEILR